MRRKRAVLLAAAAVLAAALLWAGRDEPNPYYDPAKPYMTPSGFRNPDDGERPGIGSMLRWRWERLRHERPPQDPGRIPRVALDAAVLRQPEPGWHLAWIGHSTALLQIDGVNILTDPMFSQRASPFSWYGPERDTPPALSVDQLPHIDAVLISHNHYDHLDAASVDALARQPGGPPRFLVPLGIERWLMDRGIANAQGLDWWQSTTVSRGATTVKVELLPSRHWSRRGLFDTNKTLWGSFGLWEQGGAGGSAFFAGDTGDGPVFKEIGRRAGPFDLALIPVGCYEPRWFMQGHHVNPPEAVQIAKDIGARYAVGIHWGAFRLCDEPVEAPLDDLPRALREAGMAPGKFQLWAIGERRRIAVGGKQGDAH